MNVKVTETITESRTVRVSNASDSARTYAIQAEIVVTNGAITSVGSGTVRAIGEDNIGVADFHTNPLLSVYFLAENDRCGIMEAIEAFMTATRTLLTNETPA
jgi:hypothetical protein